MNGSDSDWREQEKIAVERKFEQQLKVNANTIKDLERTNLYWSDQVDSLLEENFRLRRELNEARLSSVTYLPKIADHIMSPDIAVKIRELRHAGEQLTSDIAKLRDTFKHS